MVMSVWNEEDGHKDSGYPAPKAAGSSGVSRPDKPVHWAEKFGTPYNLSVIDIKQVNH
jgi:hypothetical protein